MPAFAPVVSVSGAEVEDELEDVEEVELVIVVEMGCNAVQVKVMS